VIFNFVEKLKESVISVAPVMAIVALLHFTIAPLGQGLFPQFLVGGILIMLGLGIFFVGADIGMLPFGHKVGSALMRKRNLGLLLFASFAIGFAITIAEPGVEVLAGQISTVMPSLDKNILVYMIAAGVGLFLLIGAGRIVLQIPLRLLLVGFYILLFAMCSLLTDSSFVGMAFDAGGATTGPVTVPFIIALGMGVAAAVGNKDGSNDSSFGPVSLAAIGPVLAVVVFGMMAKGGMAEAGVGEASDEALSLTDAFLSSFADAVYNVFMALLPLFIIFAVCQILLLKLPSLQVWRILIGLVYVFIGLVIFMTGVNGGFSSAGKSLGSALGSFAGGFTLIPIGFIIGAVIVCAEPTVWILTQQIEDITGGSINRKIMLFALSLSVALAIAIGMIRVIFGMSIWFVLLPGYALALILTRFCSPLFTAIAFDSGGVASGPITTTFILALTLGASAAIGGNPAANAFGMIAVITMAPLITIQFLGMIFQQLEKRRKVQAEQYKRESAR
jgi:hypothetical protein